ncbi:hypothetical protein E0F15_15175 [Frankia sp. B2]|nr:MULTISPECIES: type IV toxin-antitoxin system AbiEi family antitoxin domain-containing protein [Frankia]TFE28352.1 hypothetical protein E0F15_15175 [Frankia sp. B2]
MAHNPGRLSWQEIATMQAGVITIRDAINAGITRDEIRRRLNDGRWQQPFRGVLITTATPVTRMQELWGALQAVGPDAVLAGACAAGLAGLDGYGTGPVTVLLPTERRIAAPPGVLLRHSARLDITEIDPLRLPRRTAPARSVIDMAEWAATRADAQGLLVDAVRQRFVTVASLRIALARRGPISRRTLITETLDDLGRDAPRLTEIMYRRIEAQWGLPVGTPSVNGPADEPMARLDVWYEPWRVRVEIQATVPGPTVVAEPTGQLLIRLPARLARDAPAEVASLVGGALRDRGWSASVPRAPRALAS